MQKFANVISNTFNPLIVPVLAAAYLLFGANVFAFNVLNLQAKLILLGILTFFMFLLPLVSLLALMQFGMAENLNLPKRRQRFVPFLLSITFYAFCYRLLETIEGLPDLLLHLILSGIILLITALAFTSRFQISIHTMCMGSFVGMLCFIGLFYNADSFYMLLLALFVSGLVGFSRLALNAHKPYQIYSGFLVGLIVQYISLLGLTIYF